jgi:molybdate transport system substrate-binding protein
MAAFTFRPSLDAVVRLYKSDGGGNVTPDYGSTPALAKQIEGGAPADIFLSADPMWMSYLQDKGLIQPPSRVSLLTTDDVVVTRSDNAHVPPNAHMGKDYPLTAIVDDGRIAMCNPAYAEAVFARFGYSRARTN